MVNVKREKFYSDLSILEKRKLRKLLDDICENKKQQLEIFERLFIKQIKEQINLVEKVKKNEISLRRYVELNGKWSDWLESFMSEVKK